MQIRLAQQSYGKSSVRFTKVIRSGDHHRVVECTVNVRLQGDFERTYTEGDNSQVIPTDTVKNTVYVLAKQNAWKDIETFAGQLTKHFLDSFEHVTHASAKISSVIWDRIVIDGESHPHSFVRGAMESPVAMVEQCRTELTIESGLKGIQVLKTTASAFEGYLVDPYTTLMPAKDRIFATSIDAQWRWKSTPDSYDLVRTSVRESILRVFAQEFSPSVQNTLFKIGQAILANNASIENITLSMPNQHRLLYDLGRMGIENNNEIFCPTDEPYGDISATVERA